MVLLDVFDESRVIKLGGVIAVGRQVAARPKKTKQNKIFNNQRAQWAKITAHIPLSRHVETLKRIVEKGSHQEGGHSPEVLH